MVHVRVTTLWTFHLGHPAMLYMVLCMCQFCLKHAKYLLHLWNRKWARILSGDLQKMTWHFLFPNNDLLVLSEAKVKPNMSIMTSSMILQILALVTQLFSTPRPHRPQTNSCFTDNILIANTDNSTSKSLPSLLQWIACTISNCQ